MGEVTSHAYTYESNTVILCAAGIKDFPGHCGQIVEQERENLFSRFVCSPDHCPAGNGATKPHRPDRYLYATDL